MRQGANHAGAHQGEHRIRPGCGEQENARISISPTSSALREIRVGIAPESRAARAPTQP